MSMYNLTFSIKNTKYWGTTYIVPPSPVKNYYLLRLISSSSSVSDVVITLEFAWKPRCVTIISVNCDDKSTFDISSCPEAIELPSPEISTPIPSKSPEFNVV